MVLWDAPSSCGSFLNCFVLCGCVAALLLLREALPGFLWVHKSLVHFVHGPLHFDISVLVQIVWEAGGASLLEGLTSSVVWLVGFVVIRFRTTNLIILSPMKRFSRHSSTVFLLQVRLVLDSAVFLPQVRLVPIIQSQCKMSCALWFLLILYACWCSALTDNPRVLLIQGEWLCGCVSTNVCDCSDYLLV